MLVVGREMEYTAQPLVAMLGNKRKLVGRIEEIVKEIRTSAFEGRLLKGCDLFCGSSVVTRMLAGHCSELHANDLETFAALQGQAALYKPDEDLRKRAEDLCAAANAAADSASKEGVISSLYAPKVTDAIQPGERCFFTRENALRIDAYRDFLLAGAPDAAAPLLAQLLARSSRAANCKGTFTSFFRDRRGVGCWGGVTKKGLDRIFGEIRLEPPVPCPHPCAGTSTQMDAFNFLESVPDGAFDVCYADPPYNGNLYGSHYGVLNIIASPGVPENITEGSGIPLDGRLPSDFYAKPSALLVMRRFLELITRKAAFVILSYSSLSLIHI